MFGVPSIVPCLVFPPLCHVWCSLHCAMFPPLCHVWCSLHCAMFGFPSIVPCLVFPPLYHVWCSLHCAMFGVPSIVPCLVFPTLCHVWCSFHCAMFGVPSIVPCLVYPPFCHVWCSLHCAMFGVPSRRSTWRMLNRLSSPTSDNTCSSMYMTYVLCAPFLGMEIIVLCLYRYTKQGTAPGKCVCYMYKRLMYATCTRG